MPDPIEPTREESPRWPIGPPRLRKWLAGAGIALVAVVAAVVAWTSLKPSGPGPGFASGNGRIEATEIDVATKLGGRVQDIMVREGDFVTVGQTLAQMRVDVLDAQRDEAAAQSRQAVTAVASAEAQVAARRSDTAAAKAVVGQRESELDSARRRLARSKALTKDGILAQQVLDDDRASVRQAQATLTGAEAQVAAADAAITATASSSRPVPAACSTASRSPGKSWRRAAGSSTWWIWARST